MNARHKKIISVSRRSDIPAFYSQWFMNRVRQGYCAVVNPLYPERRSRLSLVPERVLAFVFWTRDPSPLIPHLPELDKKGYTYYFQYTLIGYPRMIDPGCPGLTEAVKTFRRLSRAIGKDRVVWRYDPILFSNLTPEIWHRRRISLLVNALAGYTRRLVISFIDPYQKTRRRLAQEPGPGFLLHPEAFDPAIYMNLAEYIGKNCARCGIAASSCAEEADMSRWGILPGACIDAGLIEKLTATPAAVKKSLSQRKLCLCAESADIGAYDTCLSGCPYCYATRSLQTARKNFAAHDPLSESLLSGRARICQKVFI